jgi:hypothetical protein
MDIADWPTQRGFYPSSLSWDAVSPSTSWSAVYTGQTQSISHLADRLRVSVEMPAVGLEDSGPREAFFMWLKSTGNWIRARHWSRSAPKGTMRGTPTVRVAAGAGARTLEIQTTAGATLVGGDVLKVGQQLLQARVAATANGSGHLSLPLVLPLRQPVTVGNAITWDAPTGTFQVVQADSMPTYTVDGIQLGFQVTLLEVFA